MMHPRILKAISDLPKQENHEAREILESLKPSFELITLSDIQMAAKYDTKEKRKAISDRTLTPINHVDKRCREGAKARKAIELLSSIGYTYKNGEWS